MTEWLNDIFVWMQTLAPVWVYLTVFLVSYGEHVFPPMPGDVIILFGGYAVGIGEATLPLTLLAATVAGGLGFMTMYAIGRRLGAAIHDPTKLTWLPREQTTKVEQWLRRYGMGVVAVNRFIAGGRTVIALLVGAAEMRRVPVAVLSTLSACVWSSILIGLGYYLGDNWQTIIENVRTYALYATLVAAALLGAYLLYRRFRTPRARQETAKSANEPPSFS